MRLVVFISGKGSNLTAISNACANAFIPAQIVSVISNNPSAAGLLFADQQDINTFVLDHHDFATREAHEAKIISYLDKIKPDYLILAGYMRVLSASFIDQFKYKIINIHPSLLPNYKGLNTHQRVLNDFKKGIQNQHGCSIHWVTAGVDEGQIIAQAALTISANDTESSLAKRVHCLEHQLYPLVLRHLCLQNINKPDELLNTEPIQYNEQQLGTAFNEIIQTL